MAGADRHAKGMNVLPLVKAARVARKNGQLPDIDPELQQLVDDRIVVSEWYPFDPFVRLLRIVHEAFFGGTDEGAEAMGRAAAEELFDKVHTACVHEGDPKRTIRYLSMMWGRYFDFGKLEIESSDDQARFELVGYEDMSRCHGYVLVGWVQTAIHKSNAQLQRAEVLEGPWAGHRRFVGEASWSLSRGAA